MLTPGGRVQIDRNAAGNDHWGVVAEVQIAGDAVNEGEGHEQKNEGHPASIEAIAAAGEPEWAHGITAHDRRMAVDTADGQPEEQGAAGFPAEVDAPTDPQGPGADVGRGEQKAEHHGNCDAGVVRSKNQGLHDGVEGRIAQRGAQRAHGVGKTLESIAAKGNLFRQGSQGEECGIGQEPCPCRGRIEDRNGDAADQHHGKNADHGQSPASGEAQTRFALPAVTAGQPLRADGMHLAIEREAQASVAQDQQEGQHRLFNEGRPGFVRQSQGAAMRQRPSQEEVDHRDNKLDIGAQAAATGLWHVHRPSPSAA